MGHTGNNSHTFGAYESTRYGIFFTNNKSFAELYGNVKKYKLNISKTLDLDNNNNFVYHFERGLDAFDPEERYIWQQVRGIESGSSPQYWQLFEEELGERFVRHLQDNGYDSATFVEYAEENGEEFESHTIVVLEPSLVVKL